MVRSKSIVEIRIELRANDLQINSFNYFLEKLYYSLIVFNNILSPEWV